MDGLPFSQACENNKGPILSILTGVLAGCTGVLEIGSGTGQHACHFAAHLPHLAWQPTDLAENLPVLRRRVGAYQGDNLLPEQALDVCDDPWPVPVPDAVFTANSLHIMSMSAVEQLFAGLDRGAAEGTVLAVYGPFNYDGRYTSESNAHFDQWLAQRDPRSAIRDFEAVSALAEQAGMELQADHAMPANNRLIVWRRVGLA